ncbi:MAG: type II toxin-antitoxin system HipA family toxin [Rhodospirillaceae bacterium]|nr:MAG: type II toxin-antitoxin system HipA family toxin [Rhodospirillaceae bacterium]
MPRKPVYIPLHVLLNGQFVGRLKRKASGAIDFQYDQTWLARPEAIPVSLSLSLREQRYVGEPVSAVFENLLPDNTAIRRHLAQRVGARGTDAYSLLAEIGRDCVGALQFVLEGAAVGEVGSIDGRQLKDAEIANIIRNLAHAPLGNSEDDEFRISIAGAQEKTALLRVDGKWLWPHGATATTHIVKPQIGLLDNGIDLSQSVENEHFCLRIAEACGLPTAKTEIHQFDDQSVLVIERFDRLWTKDKRLLRLPQEDCCQALSVPPSLKYQSEGGPGIRGILELLKASDDADADRKTFIKAQIVYWLLGATDGHAKNFSIRLFAGGRFRMTPLYDIMSAQPNVDAGQIQPKRFKLATSVGDKRHYLVNSITRRHFMQSAASAGMTQADIQSVFDELSKLGAKPIAKAGERLPSDFPEHIIESISRGYEARLRLLMSG